jgi:hypothetical protein
MQIYIYRLHPHTHPDTSLPRSAYIAYYRDITLSSRYWKPPPTMTMDEKNAVAGLAVSYTNAHTIELY